MQLQAVYVVGVKVVDAVVAMTVETAMAGGWWLVAVALFVAVDTPMVVVVSVAAVNTDKDGADAREVALSGEGGINK